MISPTTTSLWEQRLFALAQEAIHPSREALSHHTGWDDDQVLSLAVEECEAITARNSRSFHLASALLPGEKRRAMRALYAFCRTADNLADGNVDQPQAQLQNLREGILGRQKADGDAVLIAWAGIRARYHIPVYYAEQLLDGVGRDLIQLRYQSFDDLSVYCYGVASTVGLMSMHITGFSSQDAVPYAIKLGVALQLTNILRDVGEDWETGRLYLPLEELAAFGLDETDVAAGIVDERWRGFMRFQIDRARQLYAEAMPGIAMLHPDGRVAVAAAASLYRGILDDIEKHDYDVFHRRAHVNRGLKLAALGRAYWNVQKLRFQKMQ